MPPSGRSDPSVVAADHSGNVIHVDEQALVATAHRADCVLVLVPMMGDFVIAGAPLFRIHGDPSRLDRKRARRLVRLGDERTHRDDPAYGFRKLVDVAQRSLGTAQNDATTAVQAPLDRQLRLLSQAVRRDLHSRDDIDAALVPDQQGIGSGADVAPNG